MKKKEAKAESQEADRMDSFKSEAVSELARKIRGNPKWIGAEDLRGLTEADWLSLLDHKPNDEEIVALCDKWLSLCGRSLRVALSASAAWQELPGWRLVEVQMRTLGKAGHCGQGLSVV